MNVFRPVNISVILRCGIIAGCSFKGTPTTIVKLWQIVAGVQYNLLYLDTIDFQAVVLGNFIPAVIKFYIFEFNKKHGIWLEFLETFITMFIVL